ncbi:MAG: hypothetical protein IJ744_08565 [Lachnospiraceae bacterium]|nr:hypothetical protein [Lachnospiraceae bacterium]
MIRWSEKLVYDPLIKRWSESIKTGIEKNKTKVSYTVVTLPTNPKNLLDIYKVKELHKRFYEDKDIVIVGVALDLEGAKDLAVQILEKSYKETGGFALRDAYDPLRSAGDPGGGGAS